MEGAQHARHAFHALQLCCEDVRATRTPEEMQLLADAMRSFEQAWVRGGKSGGRLIAPFGGYSPRLHENSIIRESACQPLRCRAVFSC